MEPESSLVFGTGLRPAARSGAPYRRKEEMMSGPLKHAQLRRVWLVLFLSAFVLTGAGGTLLAPSAAQDKVAKIGVMVPITGPFGADAEDVVNAAQMAADDYNEAGGVAGYRLEIVTGDTVDQSSGAVTSAYNRLKAEPDLNFIMTAYASTSNFEIDLARV
jgi:ABC-type branched-subunit amino acid transport system substrate-binding protein